MKQTTNFNEYNIVGDDSSLTINNSSGSLVSFINGNVGIGTISPSYKLDVSGSGIFRGNLYVASDNPVIKVGDTDAAIRYSALHLSTNGGNWYFSSGDSNTGTGTNPSDLWITRENDGSDNRFRFYRDIYAFGIYSGSNANVVLNADGNSHLNGGNVGIGTSIPSETLDVNGNIKADGILKLYDITDTQTINLNSNGNSYINSGNLGIGTTSPSKKFEVKEGYILSNGSSTFHGFELARDNHSTYRIRHLDGGLTIYNVNDDRKEMTFKSNGNVGINTTTPTEKLDVNGNIKYNGSINNGVTFKKSFYLANISSNSYKAVGQLNFLNPFTHHFRVTVSSYSGFKVFDFHGYLSNLHKQSSGWYEQGQHPNIDVIIEPLSEVVGNNDITGVKIGIKNNSSIVDYVYTVTVECLSAVSSWIDFDENEPIVETSITLNDRQDVGGEALYINHTNKRLGVNRPTPTEILDVNGNIKVDGILKLYDITDTQTIELNPDGDSYVNGNIGIGTSSPFSKLDVYGAISLNGKISLRHDINAQSWYVGELAGQNSNSYRSNAFGYNASRNNTGDAYSDAFGSYALENNTAGYSNGFGGFALQNNAGSYSNAFGFQALQNNTGVNSNGFGASSLADNSGRQTNGFGRFTLRNNSGISNTALGDEAGYETSTLTGSYNTFLGSNASYGTATTISNSTAVGANVTLTDSNTVILGNGANVGIGTTSPSKALDIVANNGQQFRLTQTTADNTLKNAYINLRHYDNSEEDFTMMLGNSDVANNYLNIGGGTSIGNAATVLRFYTAANNTTTIGTVRMFINSSGNVGIGTSSPSQKLDIIGAIRMSNTESDLTIKTSYSLLRHYDNSKNDISVYTASTNSGGNSITIGGGSTSFNSATSISFNTATNPNTINGSTRMLINYNGNIGINTTTPTETLDVNGNIKADGILKLYDVTNTQTIELNPNGDSYVNGNLGIGTSNPAVDLHVADDVRIDSDLFVRTISSQYFSSSNNLKLIYGDAANFNIYSNTTERFRITSDGNVGINTTTPTEKLDVRGVIVAGDIAATTGATSFKQFYNTTGNYLTTIGSEYSSGGFVFGYGVEPKKSSLGVISTTNVNIFRSKLQLNGDKLVLSFASLQNTPIGDDITDLEDSFIFTNDTFRFNGILKLYDITDTQTIELNPDGDSYINGGNVGIGTTSPNPHNWGQRTLTVQATDTNAFSALEAYGTGSGAGAVLFGADSIMHSSVQSINGSHLAFTTNATNSGISQTERMRILSNGNVGIGTTTPTEKLDVDGNIKSSGYINGKRCGAAGYLASPVNVTVTTANTYYPIGVFTVPVAEDFVVGTTYPNGLKYNGTIAQTFHITWNATIESTSNNVTATIDIQKNGVSIAMSKMGTYAKTGGEIYNLSGQCVVDLDTDEEVRFVVTADKNNEGITFDYFTASIKEFFD